MSVTSLTKDVMKGTFGRLGCAERRRAETVKALGSVEAGRLVDGDEMLEWISSWGKNAEKKPPR